MFRPKKESSTAFNSETQQCRDIQMFLSGFKRETSGQKHYCHIVFIINTCVWIWKKKIVALPAEPLAVLANRKMYFYTELVMNLICLRFLFYSSSEFTREKN